MSPCLILSIIRYGSRVSGEVVGRELRPLLHHDIVGIKKKTSRSTLTTIGQINYNIYMCVCVCVCVSACVFMRSSVYINIYIYTKREREREREM